MQEIEIEKVYLVKELPENLRKCRHIEIQIGDFYDSNSVNALKLRQKGDEYELIKKEEISTYEREEHTIKIKQQEFDVLIKATVQSHQKVRYFYPLDNELICEIDVYKGKLDGYVRAEVEFKTVKSMNEFVAPEWFDQEITPLNHTIHKDLGLITFDEMVDRFKKEGIALTKIKDLK